MATHPTTEVGGQFKTTDLALAGVLSLQGFAVKLESARSSQKALFVFRPMTDQEATDLNATVQRFTDGEARVEPLAFQKEVRKVRDALYAFLDSGQQG